MFIVLKEVLFQIPILIVVVKTNKWHPCNGASFQNGGQMTYQSTKEIIFLVIVWLNQIIA